MGVTETNLTETGWGGMYKTYKKPFWEAQNRAKWPKKSYAPISLLICDVDTSQPIVAPPPTAVRPRPSSFKSGLKSQSLREEWRRTAWSRRTAGWMLLSTALIWCAACGSWIFYFLTPKIAPVAFDGGKTLREATQAWVGGGIKPDYDQLNLFLNAAFITLFKTVGKKTMVIIAGVKGSDAGKRRPLHQKTKNRRGCLDGTKGRVRSSIMEEVNAKISKPYDRSNEKSFIGMGFKQPTQIESLLFRRDQDRCVKNQAHWDFKAGRLQRAASTSRPNASAFCRFKWGRSGQSAAK
jgi:hypothetical protein